MPLVPFQQLMADAERGGYAVGYFESWNLESLLAVADAAETTRAPVILGFSGIYRTRRDPLAVHAAMGRAVCRQVSVPACLLFNESPDFDAVLEAVDVGFNAVMFSGEGDVTAPVKQLCVQAHAAGAAVEAELAALPGVGGELAQRPADLRLTDPEAAGRFVTNTGVDALAVNVGQVHLHGRQKVRLDLERLDRLKQAVRVPLVLHGASSVADDDLVAAIRRGIRKINVGSVLKQTYFRALRDAAVAVAPNANPYEIIGSGLDRDVLMAGRVAMQRKVEELMRLFGSAGKAGQ